MARGGPCPTAFGLGLDEVAAELRARTRRRGTRERVAHELGVSLSHLSNLMAGRRAPAPRVLAKLGFRIRFERVE